MSDSPICYLCGGNSYSCNRHGHTVCDYCFEKHLGTSEPLNEQSLWERLRDVRPGLAISIVLSHEKLRRKPKEGGKAS